MRDYLSSSAPSSHWCPESEVRFMIRGKFRRPRPLFCRQIRDALLRNGLQARDTKAVFARMAHAPPEPANPGGKRGPERLALGPLSSGGSSIGEPSDRQPAAREPLEPRHDHSGRSRAAPNPFRDDQKLSILYLTHLDIAPKSRIRTFPNQAGTKALHRR
jgi:hypothetical protein